MPRITKTTGTGMTRRGVVRFDAEEPDDIQALIKAGVHTFDRSSFQRLSRRLAGLAASILSDAGLPSDPERLYLIASDGTWSAPEAEAAVDEEADYLPLDQAVQACGYQPDSPEGYAAALLMILMMARQHLQAGTVDEAMALAFDAGELVKEAGMKDMFDAEFVIGERVSQGGRIAHERTYGTKDEKEARKANYRRAVEIALARGFPRMKAYESVAKFFGVKARTIRRAVADKNNSR